MAFSPLRIPGLRLWLKADAITGVSNGAALSPWNDSSGQGNNGTNGVGANQPIYNTNVQNGLPAVAFSPTQSLQLANAWPSQSWTVACVLKPTSFAGFMSVFSGNASGPGWQVTQTTGQMALVKTSTVLIGTAGTALSTSAFNLIAVTYASPNAAFYYGTAADGAASSAQAFTLGAMAVADIPSGAQFFTGSIGEVVAYDNVISAGDLAKLLASLKAKWGL